MAKRKPRPPAPVPAVNVRDETVDIPRGETTYTIDLDEATVDALAVGVCPVALTRRMYSLLDWRRAALRQLAQENR